MQNGKCSQNFPKPFRDQTTISEDAYASTRCWDTRQIHQVHRKQVDNYWVVTYSSGSIIAISISSPSHLSRSSNTSTSMSTKAMIVSLCSLVLATMRSSSISTLAISQPVRAFGISSTFSCIVLSPTSSDSKSIFQASSMLPEMRTDSRPSRRLPIMPQNVTPLLLDTSRPISSIQSLHRTCLTRTSFKVCVGSKDTQVEAQTVRICYREDALCSAHC
jgi:hypothetical protein